MKRGSLQIGLLAFSLFLLGQASAGHAAIVVNGYVDPFDSSTWNETTTELQIGYSANSGSVAVSGTEHVFNYTLKLGLDADSTGTLDISGENAVWTNAGTFHVGELGDGTVNISDSALIESKSNVAIGYNGASSGEVTVDGGTLDYAGTASSYLYVGYYGNGSLTVENGGTVTDFGTLELGYQSGSSGSEITIDGEDSIVTTGYVCAFWRGNGTLDITNGGKLVANTSGVNAGVNSAGTGGIITVDGIGSVLENVNPTPGSTTSFFKVGQSTNATLYITNGGLVQSDSQVTIDQNADYDSSIRMSTGGMLAILGDADDSLTQFLTDLVIGTTDDIMWWNSSTSSWDLLTTATAGTDYTLQYMTTGDLAGYTLLTVGQDWIPGDANKDGFVDGSDATILANYWQYGVGMTNPDATWAMGDFNGDHVVDGSDATLLASHWQEGTPPPSAVPEPGCVTLLLTLLAAAGVLRRFAPALKKQR